MMVQQVSEKARMIVLLAGAALLGFAGFCWGATAVLNPPPYAVESLSDHIFSAKIAHQVVAKDPVSGEDHILIGYVTDGPFQLVDINPMRGSVRQVEAMTSFSFLWNSFALHPSGKYYIASYDPGYLYEYDLQTGIGRIIRGMADKGGMCLTVGDDGKLYIGGSIKGYLERYDPATGVWDNFGVLDDPGPPYYRFAYTVGADSRYVYVAVGKIPWYLVVYDTETGSTQTFWKDSALSNLSVVKGKTGGWYANASGLGWFSLSGGQPVPIQTAPAVISDTMRGGVCRDETFAACDLPWEIDLARATPSAASVDPTTAEIAWTRIGAWSFAPRLRFIDDPSGTPAIEGPSGTPVPGEDTSSSSVKFNIRLVAKEVKQLVQGPGDKVFGLTDFYGPLFRFPNDSEASFELLGANQRSNYDALYLPERDRWYIVGYPAALLEYDPNAPWTLIAGRDPADTTLNPHQPVTGFGKYHHYLARGSDGLVYVGVHQEREAVGGEIGWFDPVARTKGSLRAPFMLFDVQDLKSALNGQKLVYSSKSLDGVDAKIFVFDVASKTIEREIVPLPGVSVLDKVVETSPGVVVGVAGSTVYSVDIRNGQVLYQKAMGGKFGTALAQDRRLVLGPDGYVWLVFVPDGAGSRIARIDPTNGTLELLQLQGVSNLVNFIFVRNASGTKYDVLLYGGEEIRRLSGVLRNTE